MLDLDKITARLKPVFGKVNDRWVRSLPEQLATLASEWELKIGEPFTTGFSAVVVSCTGPMGDAVVKLEPEAYALAEEAAMLRQFAPSGRVPAVLATAKGALLLEAVRPGTPVKLLPEAPPSPTDWALLLNALHSAGDPASAPRELPDWLELLYASAARAGASITELAESRKIAEELLAAPLDRVLLHGDLNFGNVMVSEDRGLVAKNPTACAGERCFDAADYALEGWDRAEIVRRRDELARAADLDLDRLDAWCRVLAPLGAPHLISPPRMAELRAFGRGEY